MSITVCPHGTRVGDGPECGYCLHSPPDAPGSPSVPRAGGDGPSVPAAGARAVIHHPETDGWHDDSLLCDRCPGFAEVADLRARTARAEADGDARRATLRDTLALVDDLHAALQARVAERVAATERAERLEGLLRRVEWCGELRHGATVLGPVPVRFCPFCRGTTAAGHAAGCEWVAALASPTDPREAGGARARE